MFANIFDPGGLGNYTLNLPKTESLSIDEDNFETNPRSNPTLESKDAGTVLKEVQQSGSSYFEFPKDEEWERTVKEKYYNSNTLSKNLFNSVNFSIFPDDYFMINDISLDDIPITSVGTDTTDSVFVAETLRSKSPVIVPNGRGDTVLSMSLFFNSGKPQVKLRRLISQLRNNPLVYIYNNKIREDLGVLNEDNTIFILEHGSLRNAQDAVGAIVLDLMFHYFNYKPFSRHFWYNAKMAGYTPSKKKAINTDIKIQDFGGYEPSSFSKSLKSEQVIEEINSGALNILKSTEESNVPVNIPKASDAWMYYADFLENNAPAVSEEMTDSISFFTKGYNFQIPPSEARLGKGDMNKVFTGVANYEQRFKNVAEVYKINEPLSGTYSDQRAAETAKATAKATKNTNKKNEIIDSTRAISFINVNTGGSLSVSLVNERNEVLTDTIHRLTSFADRRKKTKHERTFLAEGLILHVLAVANNFPGKTIEIISTMRDPKWIAKGLSGPKNGKKPSKHITGHAMDFRVKGISNRILFDFIKTLSNVGAGYYPNSVFCHMDYRSPSTYWIDTSEKNEKTIDLITTRNIKALNEKLYSDYGESKTEAEADRTDNKEERKEQDQDIATDKGSAAMQIQEEKERKERVNQSRSEEEDTFRTTELEEEPAETEEKIKKINYKARKEWIKNQENKGNFYYKGDASLRNLFYTVDPVNISSNRKEQTSGNALLDIVFSGVSVSFGHRISPIHLCGQTSPTWQFLGPGNRAGTMVFTFVGEEGRVSAASMKRMFSYAKGITAKYKSFVPDAGAFYINPYDADRKINNIFALLDINAIVITNVEETSTQESSDKYQLVVRFAVQDFRTEELDRAIFSSLDIKVGVIKRLFSFFEPRDTNKDPIKISSNVIVARDPEIVTIEDMLEKYTLFGPVGGEARPYKIVDKNMPPDLANVLLDLLKLIKETDEKIPETSIPLKADNIGITWMSRYDDLGIPGLLRGKYINNKFNSEFLLGGKPSEDGGSLFELVSEVVGIPIDRSVDIKTTSTRHAQAYNNFEFELGLIVERVRKSLATKGWSLYFKDAHDEMIEQLSNQARSNCFSDISLPPMPNTKNFPLPPDFYIYDDSNEDPSLRLSTDRESLEKRLDEHIVNDTISKTYYMKNMRLGGSYMSKNLPKVLEAARGYTSTFEDEITWFNYEDVILEGASTWDALTYRPDSIAEEGKAGKAYVDFISTLYSGKGSLFTPSEGKDSGRFSFLNDVAACSRYLSEGRSTDWKTRLVYDNNPEAVITSIYGDDWDSILFGPNKEYTLVDQLLSGELQSETIAQAKKQTTDITTKTSDGAVVTLGMSPSDIEDKDIATANKKANENSFSGILGVLDEAASHSYALALLSPILIPILTAPIALVAAGTYAFNSFSSSDSDSATIKTAEERSALGDALKEKLKNKHPIGEKLAKNSNSTLSKLAAGIALGSKADDLSIRRVFPSFRIFFIERDQHENIETGGKKFQAFDDFYSYSSIQEIKVIRSRKVAADLAIIRMTNVAGILLRKRFGTPEGKEKYLRIEETESNSPLLEGTKYENPFSRMVLRDGVMVQVRLGYAVNPEQLDTVFLGQIIEVAPSEDGQILEIMCQGFGAELEAVEQGEEDGGSEFYSHQSALGAAIIQPSIVNFGRQSKFNRQTIGEQRHDFTGGSGKAGFAFLNPADHFRKWSQNKLYKALYERPFLNDPQDDNIFAPPPHMYIRGVEQMSDWSSLWLSTCSFSPTKQTAWEIFKEHELRLPGYISSAVPYGHEPRMTMFFGAKGQNYWSRPPTAFEMTLSNSATDFLKKMGGLSMHGLSSEELKKKISIVNETSSDLALAIVDGLRSFSPHNKIDHELGKITGRYRPFRNHHYLDSEHHIIKNNIRTSVDGTFNELELHYNEKDVSLWTSLLATPLLVPTILYNSIFKGEQTLSTKLDENISDEDIRSLRVEYPSCQSEDMAKKYTQGLFQRGLKDCYKGDLIVIGDSRIKPYDICQISDSSIGMTGPIEVEQVEHIFNREQGFVSIITPDLCVDGNELFSLSALDLTCAANVYTRSSSDNFNTRNSVVSRNPFNFLGEFAANKVALWTQEGTPVIVTPLTFQGNPLLSISLGGDRGSYFSTLHGKWDQWWDDADVAWDRLDIGEEISDMMDKVYVNGLKWGADI